MNACVRDQQDLNRMNIQLAWQFSDRMRADEFEELCRVTIQQVHRDASGPERCVQRLQEHGV